MRTKTDQSEYELKVSLSALRHLGINLYSNIPAVISEAVANSWDADAEHVDIDIDEKKKTITISDDGIGMDKDDLNNKYLSVGYLRRDHEPPITPKHKRHVMGRKGIGKLSLFSIAKTIEVVSVKEDASGEVHKNGLKMNYDGIEKSIKKKEESYKPTPINESQIKIDRGTRIVLSGLRRSISRTQTFLRKRLARRFSIIGAEYDFEVKVNGKPIGVQDRDFFNHIEYLWTIGDDSRKFTDACKNALQATHLSGVINAKKKHKISGWVGTFDQQKSIEEGNNSIVLLAWGKLIHEDLLKDIKEGGVYSKYLIGEIRADFLDSDNQADMATSDRQSLKEDDPRFKTIKKYVQDKILKSIQTKWLKWRSDDSEEKARENSVINEWFTSLGPDRKKYARALFQQIETLAIDEPDDKRELYKHGILAFEKLVLKDELSMIETLNTESDFALLKRIFSSVDELEAFEYYHIVKGRVDVLTKFESIVPASKERVIQEHIFSHLWLLDPSWERANEDARMEEAMSREFKGIDAKLSEAERKARLDIRYKTAAGKHIVIELKKYRAPVESMKLANQVRKYRDALMKCLKTKYPDEPHLIEIICIVGSPPTPLDQDEDNRKLLSTYNARYITYDTLIRQTKTSYGDYLDKQKEVARIIKLVNSL